MAKTSAEKAAQRRYVESHREKIREIQRRADKKRGPRPNQAEYMREYRRRQKEKLQQQQEGETG